MVRQAPLTVFHFINLNYYGLQERIGIEHYVRRIAYKANNNNNNTETRYIHSKTTYIAVTWAQY